MIVFFLIIFFSKKILKKDLHPNEKFSIYNRNKKQFLGVKNHQPQYLTSSDQNFYLDNNLLYHKELLFFSKNDVIHLSPIKMKNTLHLKFLGDSSHQLHILNSDNKCLGGEIFRNDTRECDIFELRKNNHKQLIDRAKKFAKHRSKKKAPANILDNISDKNDLDDAFTKLRNAYCNMIKKSKK